MCLFDHYVLQRAQNFGSCGALHEVRFTSLFQRVMAFLSRIADFTQKGIALTCFVGSLVLLTLAGRGSFIVIQRRKELERLSTEEARAGVTTAAEMVRGFSFILNV